MEKCVGHQDCKTGNRRDRRTQSTRTRATFHSLVWKLLFGVHEMWQPPRPSPHITGDSKHAGSTSFSIEGDTKHSCGGRDFELYCVVCFNFSRIYEDLCLTYVYVWNPLQKRLLKTCHCTLLWVNVTWAQMGYKVQTLSLMAAILSSGPSLGTSTLLWLCFPHSHSGCLIYFSFSKP